MEQEQYMFEDVYGNNYKNLSKEEAIKLYESFIKSKKGQPLYDLGLIPCAGNRGEALYLWSPCQAMQFVLTSEETSRLYPTE